MPLCTCVQNLFRVTALIVKTLADIHEYVPLESGLLTNTINWLINNCQNADGSFSGKSQTNPLKIMVCKKRSVYDIILYFAVFWSRGLVSLRVLELMSLKRQFSSHLLSWLQLKMLWRSQTLTYWYDLTTKSKCQIFQANHSGLFVLSPQTFKNAIDRAAQYINSNSMKIECLYARAIASYALVLADIHSMSGVSLYEKIKKQAQVVGKILFGTLLTKHLHSFWHNMTHLSTPLTFSGNPATIRFWQESKQDKDLLKPSHVTAKSVETTIYVLLNTLARGDATYAKPILNWLTQDQRYGGGVHSTQVLQCRSCIYFFYFNCVFVKYDLSFLKFSGRILTWRVLTKVQHLSQSSHLRHDHWLEYRLKGTSAKSN